MSRTVSATLSADGNGSELIVSSPEYGSEGFHLHLSGTFGGGTVTVQFKAADGNWKTMADISFTTAADRQIMIPNNTSVRIVLTGATTPSLFYQLSCMSLK